MRRMLFLTLILFAASGATAEMTGPQLAAKMIEAHGGIEAWKAATILHFEHKMLPPAPPGAEPDPWLSVETIEAGSRRVHQSWPLDEAVVVFDCDEVWSTGWKRANPPKFMVHLAYYFLCLPFLTQDPGVNLEYTGMGRFPTADKDYHQLRMTFDAGVGDSPDDYYVIFVDPESYEMKGTEFVVTYGPMLDLFNVPPDVKFIGPLYKVYDETVEADGLLMPARYKTYTPDGTMYGDHWVSDYRFRGEFDVKLMTKPADAVVDTSTNERKATAETG